MKIILAFLIVFSVAFPVQASYWDTPEFKELLELTGLDSTKAKDLNTIVAMTQEGHWKMPGERFAQHEVPQILKTNEKKIISLAQRFGFVEKIEPKKKTYDRILFLGGTEYRARSRMVFGIEQTIKHNLTFKKIVCMGSTRDLNQGSNADKLAAAKIGNSYPQTENGMMRFLWEKELDQRIPKALKIETIWVNAGPSGKNPRATLDDTVNEWLMKDQDLKAPMSVLIVSDQPHISNQHQRIIGLLRAKNLGGLNTEAIGDEIGDRTESTRVLLDAIRQDLYYTLKNTQPSA